MVPEKDIALYGYGSVAWKDRMEEWKRRQNDKLQVVRHPGGDFDGGDPDLPMLVIALISNMQTANRSIIF